MKLPPHAIKLDRFKAWLLESGAIEQTSNNPYEVIRFTSSEGLGIVYTNSKGVITLQGSAVTAYSFFKAKKTWRATVLYQPWEKPEVREALLSRDGDCCFYCGKKMPSDDMTIEHILSLESGGNNNNDNLALAHFLCNSAAGSLPIAEKIKILLSMREKQ